MQCTRPNICQWLSSISNRTGERDGRRREGRGEGKRKEKEKERRRGEREEGERRGEGRGRERELEGEFLSSKGTFVLGVVNLDGMGELGGNKSFSEVQTGQTRKCCLQAGSCLTSSPWHTGLYNCCRVEFFPGFSVYAGLAIQ